MEKPVITCGDVAIALEAGNISHIDKVQIIALCLAYLNAGSITFVANQINLSYNGVGKHRQVLDINGLKIAIPNENEVTEI